LFQQCSAMIFMSLTLQSIRRIAATGLWLALIVLAPLSEQMSLTMSAFVVGLVSLASGLAIVLAVGRRASGDSDANQTRYVLACLSLAISVWWAMNTAGNDPLLLVTMVMVASLANSVVWPLVLCVETVKDVTASVISVPTNHPVSESAADYETVLSASERLELRLHQAYSGEFEQTASEDCEPSADARTQWFTRSITDAGEVIEGGFRIDFAEGQREVTVHVPFCPPLASIPEMVTEDLDGHDLDIRVAAIFPYGARLTVRRPAGSESAHADSCRIGYVAFTATIRQAA